MNIFETLNLPIAFYAYASIGVGGFIIYLMAMYYLKK